MVLSALFFEPQSFCSRNEAGVDSLGLFNPADSTMIVAITAPDWIEDLPATVTIPPDHYANLRFVWRNQVPPEADSIVVEEGKARIVIPIDLFGLGTPEPGPPDIPILAEPLDEARFMLGDTMM